MSNQSMHPLNPLRGPAKFWPFLAVGTAFMVGWSLFTAFTGGWGVVTGAHGQAGQPIVLHQVAPNSDAPYLIWKHGAPDDANLDCSFSGDAANGLAFDVFPIPHPATVGPDGQRFEYAMEIARPFKDGETMTCTSTSGTPKLLVGKDLTRTTATKTALFGFVGFGGGVLALIGWFAARRRTNR